MYGNFGHYFNEKKEQFYNSIWIELIGFDREMPDYGIKKYFETTGFVPDCISLHLSSVDFVNTHKGMQYEYLLPTYACSYCGRSENDDRKRQEWTNYDLLGLVRKLKEHKVKVYGSFFDLICDKEFTDAYPELLACCTNKQETEKGILMIKRFSNGKYYEDYFLKMLIQTAADYEFDGIQLADGISSPRNPIWFADFSDDIIEQSKITIPDDVCDSVKWIQENKRSEWIEFYRQRWTAFLSKIITGLKQKGIEIAVNSAWTRDPFEAIYRYGADYKNIECSGADYFVVEDVSSDLAILSYEDNHNFAMTHEQRRMVHYEFIANLMIIKAHIGKIPITPLFMIWDNQEQWNVIHHAPTALQRAATANFSRFCVKDDELVPITNGPHFCLGDALKPGDWDFIRLAIDNGYTENVVDVEGATFLWSKKRMENELSEFIMHGSYHSAKWLAVLIRSGAAINKIANINDLHLVSENIVVTNYSLMDSDEQKKINDYKKGRVIYVEHLSNNDVSKITNPVTTGWPRPLNFCDVPNELIEKYVEEINESVNIYISDGVSECGVVEVKTGEDTSRIFIDNNEFYYVLPKVHTKRAIKNIKVITKPSGYPLKWDSHSFKVRVPGRGIDIAEVVYE